MTTKRKARSIDTIVSHPRLFLSRLVLAEVLAKRGEGALERKRLVYVRRER